MLPPEKRKLKFGKGPSTLIHEYLTSFASGALRGLGQAPILFVLLRLRHVLFAQGVAVPKIGA